MPPARDQSPPSGVSRRGPLSRRHGLRPRNVDPLREPLWKATGSRTRPRKSELLTTPHGTVPRPLCARVMPDAAPNWPDLTLREKALMNPHQSFEDPLGAICGNVKAI